MPLQSGEYRLLSNNDDDAEETIGKPIENGELGRLISWSTMIVALCTIIDVLLLFSFTFGIEAMSHPSAAQPRDLELRSTYIGFDRLYGKGTSFNISYPPIVNHARMFLQVSSRRPDEVLPAWPVWHMTHNGYSPAGERRLLVTSEITTIVQFRVLDYGMERCKLTIKVPPVVNRSELIIVGPDGEAPLLDVWSLETTRKLDFKSLSWSTKPKRVALVGASPVAHDTEKSLTEFTCVSGSYQTFEIACRRSPCHVDMTTESHHGEGLYILQSQTV